MEKEEGRQSLLPSGHSGMQSLLVPPKNTEPLMEMSLSEVRDQQPNACEVQLVYLL